MKRLCIILTALLTAGISASEVYVDGAFDDFKRQWSLSTKRNGVVEVIRVNGVNFVQIASENNPQGQIGIYTARGIEAKCGDKFTVTANIKGAAVTISIMEYGNKKFLANQDKRGKSSADFQSCTANFTVSDPKTDLVRISFKAAKGAVAVVSNVKVDKVSGENKK